MTRTDPFAMQKLGLNDFLFAEIGIEPSGTPLNLLSVFARVDRDPWQEAQRFADLPGHLAISDLAGLITASGVQRGPEATTVAESLVKLLPGGHRAAPDVQPTPSWSKGQNVLQFAVVLVAVLLTATMLVSGDLTHPAAVSAPASTQRPVRVPAPGAASSDSAQVPTSD